MDPTHPTLDNAPEVPNRAPAPASMPPAAVIPHQPKIANVEAARGIAALLVLLHHAEKFYFHVAGYWSGDALRGFFQFGYAGVEFFFVLSGYIMLLVHYDDVGVKGKASNFLRKRFIRIYPFFWVILAISLVLLFVFPHMERPLLRRPDIILQSILLVGVDPLNSSVPSSWSLWHEVLFYAVCALVIWRPRLGLITFVVWSVLCLVLNSDEDGWFGANYVTSSINALFAMGAASALYLRNRRVAAPVWVLLLGVGLFVGTGIVDDYGFVGPPIMKQLLFGAGSALILLGLVEVERSRGWKAPAWLVALGAASFSIYLAHTLALSLISRIAVKLHLTQILPSAIGLLLLSAGAVVAGVIVHHLVEKPAVAFTRKVLSRLGAKASDRAPEKAADGSFRRT